MLSSHESCTHSPTYLVVFELGVNTRENQFFATNYLFKRAGHLLKPPVLHHGILHFFDRLSALFSRFRCETEEIKTESQRKAISSGITKKAQGCPLGTIPEPIPLCQYGWEKVVKIRGTISSNPCASYFSFGHFLRSKISSSAPSQTHSQRPPNRACPKSGQAPALNFFSQIPSELPRPAAKRTTKKAQSNSQ